MPSKVMLNVYDLSTQNSYTYWCGLGVFHAGVEVYGIEYAYGGHDYDCSGVFATNPRDAPGPVVFREGVCMGETSLSQSEVERVVQQLGQDFKGNKYHLLQRNCNHFANDLCQRLVEKDLPAWVNRLASMAVMLHCLLPPAWVPSLETPIAVSGMLGPSVQRSCNSDTQALIQAGERSSADADGSPARVNGGFSVPPVPAKPDPLPAIPAASTSGIKSPPGSAIFSGQL